jgi:P4 family phage/plasmid primase-like protien
VSAAPKKETPAREGDAAGAVDRQADDHGKSDTAPVDAPAQLEFAVQVLTRSSTGFPAKPGKACNPLGISPVAITEALTRNWDCDAHLVAYKPVQIQGSWVRLNLHSRPNDFKLFDVIKAGTIGPVVMQWAIFDVDAPGHLATEEWWSSVERRLYEKLNPKQRPVWYRTAGGGRLVSRLANPVIVATREGYAAWRAEHFARAAALKRLMQIEADPACADITRLYRLPFVKRDDGRACPSLQVPWAVPPDWAIKITDADRKAAARMVKAVVRAAGEVKDAPKVQPVGDTRRAMIELVAGAWQLGKRNAQAYAITGVLARAGWTDVAEVVEEIVKTAGATDCTYEIDAALDATTEGTGPGWPALEKAFGEELKDRVSDLLDPDPLGETLASATPLAANDNAIIYSPDATDAVSIARTFLRSGQELFVAEKKAWYRWQAMRWVRDVDNRVYRRMSKVLDRLDESVGTDKQIEAARNRLGLHVDTAAKLGSVSASSFDADPNLLNFEDGTLDLRDFIARPHATVDLLTKLIPIKLNAEPTEEAKAIWSSFVASIFVSSDKQSDRELADFVQRAVGYTLSGGGREKTFFYSYGETDSGKSTFLRALAALLGEYASTPAGTVFAAGRQHGQGHNADLIPMVGCRAAIVDELPDMPFDVRLINLITGGGSQSISDKGEKAFTWTPRMALWLGAEVSPASNPRIRGFIGRMRRIPFLNKFAKDPAFTERLMMADVMTAALHWALEGVALYREKGLGTCKAVETSTQEYADEQDDPVAAFLDDVCSKAGWTSTAALHGSYCIWRAQHGYRSAPETIKVFGKRLAAAGAESDEKGKAKVRGWKLTVMASANERAGESEQDAAASDPEPAGRV